MNPWTCLKLFKLTPESLTIENGLLTQTLKLKRREVKARFANEIQALFS